MSESEGIVGLLTKKTQDGIKHLVKSTGYDLSKVNLNENELERLQAYQGFVGVVKDVLKTVVSNEQLDEPTRAKYTAALKEADEFLTHLEIRTLGVTFFRSLYKSAARLVEEQRGLAGASNEKAGLLEAQLAELTGKYKNIEAQYSADKEAWAAREQGYKGELVQKDEAYATLQHDKDVLQELANTLARANGDLRNESASKDNLIYELGQARERDRTGLRQERIDLELRVGQERAKTEAAEGKTNQVVEALKQTLIVNYGLTEGQLAEAVQGKDPAEIYLGLLNGRIAQDKLNIQAAQAELEEERRQRAEDYKSAVEAQPAEVRQEDLTGVLDELDSVIGLEVGTVQAPATDEETTPAAELHDDAQEAREIAERTLDRFQEVAGLSKRTLDEVTAGMIDGTVAVEPPSAPVAPEEPPAAEDVLLDDLEEVPPADTQLLGLPEVEFGLAISAVAEPDESEAETLVVEPVAPPIEPVAPAEETDLATAFGGAVSPPEAQELDLATALGQAVQEGVVPEAVEPAAEEVDLATAFGSAVPQDSTDEESGSQTTNP